VEYLSGFGITVSVVFRCLQRAEGIQSAAGAPQARAGFAAPLDEITSSRQCVSGLAESPRRPFCSARHTSGAAQVSSEPVIVRLAFSIGHTCGSRSIRSRASEPTRVTSLAARSQLVVVVRNAPVRGYDTLATTSKRAHTNRRWQNVETTSHLTRLKVEAPPGNANFAPRDSKGKFSLQGLKPAQSD